MATPLSFSTYIKKTVPVTLIALPLLTVGCSSSAPPQAGTPAVTPPAPVSTAKFAYVSTYSDNTISMSPISSTGQWTPTSPATIPAGTQPAVVTADSQGKFVYVSNIRDATIGMYAINQTTGV